MKIIKMLPCPKCKGDSSSIEYKKNNSIKMDLGDELQVVKCNKCGFEGPIKLSKEKALIAFNEVSRGSREYCECRHFKLFSKCMCHLKEHLEVNVVNRWEQHIPHHPKTIEMMTSMIRIDRELNGNHFQWNTGEAGDNGKTMMYEMDIYFEAKDKGII